MFNRLSLSMTAVFFMLPLFASANSDDLPFTKEDGVHYYFGFELSLDPVDPKKLVKNRYGQIDSYHIDVTIQLDGKNLGSTQEVEYRPTKRDNSILVLIPERYVTSGAIITLMVYGADEDSGLRTTTPAMITVDPQFPDSRTNFSSSNWADPEVKFVGWIKAQHDFFYQYDLGSDHWNLRPYHAEQRESRIVDSYRLATKDDLAGFLINVHFLSVDEKERSIQDFLAMKAKAIVTTKHVEDRVINMPLLGLQTPRTIMVLYPHGTHQDALDITLETRVYAYTLDYKYDNSSANGLLQEMLTNQFWFDAQVGHEPEGEPIREGDILSAIDELAEYTRRAISSSRRVNLSQLTGAGGFPMVKTYFGAIHVVPVIHFSEASIMQFSPELRRRAILGEGISQNPRG